MEQQHRNKTMSDTPRTDEAEFPVFTWPPKANPMVVLSEVSKQLERELAEAREQRDRLAEALESFLSQTVAPVAPLREALAAVKGGTQ